VAKGCLPPESRGHHLRQIEEISILPHRLPGGWKTAPGKVFQVHAALKEVEEKPKAWPKSIQASHSAQPNGKVICGSGPTPFSSVVCLEIGNAVANIAAQ